MRALNPSPGPAARSTLLSAHARRNQGFEAFAAKMEAAGLSKAAIDAFQANYKQLVEGVTGLVGRTDVPGGRGARLGVN